MSRHDRNTPRIKNKTRRWKLAKRQELDRTHKDDVKDLSFLPASEVTSW